MIYLPFQDDENSLVLFTTLDELGGYLEASKLDAEIFGPFRWFRRHLLDGEIACRIWRCFLATCGMRFCLFWSNLSMMARGLKQCSRLWKVGNESLGRRPNKWVHLCFWTIRDFAMWSIHVISFGTLPQGYPCGWMVEWQALSLVSYKLWRLVSPWFLQYIWEKRWDHIITFLTAIICHHEILIAL